MDIYAVVSEPLAQRGLRQLAGELGDVRECVVVGSAGAVTGKPDAVLTVGQPPAAMRVLSSRYPTVALVTEATTEAAFAALRAGVRSVVGTSVDAAELRVAIDVARAGAGYFGRSLSARMRDELAAGPESALNRRETETLTFIAHGFTHAQTARHLGVSEATVNTYLNRIRSKLRAGNKADLTRHAIGLRLTQPASSRR
ncbi:response regulator transcription factor [Actinoplanes sp. NPDC051494]|uniref:response regulator transcription factor n=1 Tax=Actinoplanes sp. NPDC051494 TaxID=3363907 RepID=UPI0037AF4825